MPAPKGHEPYKGCETGGRPEIYTKEFIENEADLFAKWLEDPENFYFKDFAIQRGYLSKRFNEWSEINEKFSGTLARAKEIQESKLTNAGLKGKFKEQMTKFVLANCHNWREKAENELKGDGLKISLVDYSKKAKESE